MIAGLRRRLDMTRFRSELGRIDELQAVDTDAGRADVAIGFLTCSRHLRMMILAAKSFYHFADIVCPLYVWDDGSLTPRDRERIFRTFPRARLYRRSELDYGRLEEFEATRRFAQQQLPQYESYAPSLKLFGPLLSPGAPSRFILSDSDAFFFDWPGAVAEWLAEPAGESRYLQPFSGQDNVAEGELTGLYRMLGLDACPRINSGLLLLDGSVFQLNIIEKTVRWYQDRKYAWDIEQTIYRILMAKTRSLPLDQDDYVLCLRKYSAVCHHFFTSVIEESGVVRDKIKNLLDYVLECERLKKPPVVVAREMAMRRGA
jgi:hypothetical protein